MTKREVNKKNYIRLAALLITVVVFTLIVANMYNTYLERNIDGGYLAKHVKTIQFDDLENAKVEFFEDTLLYISFTGDREIYSFDRDLGKRIGKYGIEEIFFYLNMIDHKEDSYIEKINKTLELTNIKVISLPAMLYFRDGVLIDILDESNTSLSVSEFSRFIEMYELNRINE